MEFDEMFGIQNNVEPASRPWQDGMVPTYYGLDMEALSRVKSAVEAGYYNEGVENVNTRAVN
jgi:hypothetical protein